MQLKVFAIRDTKSEMYGQPFFQHSAGEAERSFKTLVNDEKSLQNKYPEDYDLYELGTYDDTVGKIIGHDTPHHVVKAVQLKSVIQ